MGKRKRGDEDPNERKSKKRKKSLKAYEPADIEMEDAGYRWSSKEDELLGRVLKEYVEIHFGDVENALQTFLDGKLKRRAKFWENLQQQHFPNRNVKSLYDHSRRRFNTRNYQGGWSDADKQRIHQLVADHGHDWRTIGDSLHRLPGECKDYWRRYGREFKTGKWLFREDQALKQAIIRITGSLPENSAGLPWTQISLQMGTRHADACRDRWAIINENLKHTSHLSYRSKERKITSWTSDDSVNLLCKLSKSWPPHTVHYHYKKLKNEVVDSRVWPLPRVLKQLMQNYEVDKKKLHRVTKNPSFLEW